MIEAAFEAWRAEIADELQEVKTQLADALTELASAEAAREAATEHLQAVQQATSVVRGPLAFAVAVRVRAASEDQHTAAGVAARIRGQVTGARSRVIDLEEALQQLGRILAPAQEETDEAA